VDLHGASVLPAPPGEGKARAACYDHARVEPTAPLECVALLLVRDRRVLVEQRKLTKRLAPGALAIPGGHVDAGESLDEALMREADEELAVAPREAAFVCTLMHLAAELRRLHYFAVRRWDGPGAPGQGEIVSREAEAVVWLGMADAGRLDFDVDRTAVSEYLRLEREGGLAWRTRT
jgi:8-oxo-dGTP pyrophosphatase MutT (NUDIX family)